MYVLLKHKKKSREINLKLMKQSSIKKARMAQGRQECNASHYLPNIILTLNHVYVITYSENNNKSGWIKKKILKLNTNSTNEPNNYYQIITVTHTI